MTIYMCLCTLHVTTNPEMRICFHDHSTCTMQTVHSPCFVYAGNKFLSPFSVARSTITS
jgi:hypothetical protein